MLFLLGPWALSIVLIFVSALSALYLYYQKNFRYWASRNVPTVTTPTFPLGDFRGVGSTIHVGHPLQRVYERAEGQRFVGFWTLFKPILLIRDPELIKQIFVKDFNSFRDRGSYVDEKRDPLSAHLFLIGGTRWRNLRAKLTPTFTSGKMKLMFPIIQESSAELVNVLKSAGTESVEVKDLTARFTTDVISMCAFGIQTNSLKDPNAEFRVMGRKIFATGIVPTLRLALPTFVPAMAKLIKLNGISKEVSDFFFRAVKETVEFRETNKVKRNDFIQLLIQLLRNGKIDNVDEGKGETIEKTTSQQTEKAFKDTTTISLNDVAAQAFVFFIAGFETSSTTMQFLLYELAKQPEIQDKCRKEVMKVIAENGGAITYEGLFETHYLNRAIDETLRLYPVVTSLTRECNTTYPIPESNVVVEKGTMIQISTLGLHRDPAYYPDPLRFDPDRFTEEVKATRPHYAYLPFGEGPRNCIGERFGLMQIRVGVAALLSNFKIDFAKDTPTKLMISPKQFIYTTDGGLPLKFVPLK